MGDVAASVNDPIFLNAMVVETWLPKNINPNGMRIGIKEHMYNVIIIILYLCPGGILSLSVEYLAIVIKFHQDMDI